jgi:hypothetical protein
MMPPGRWGWCSAQHLQQQRGQTMSCTLLQHDPGQQQTQQLTSSAGSTQQVCQLVIEAGALGSSQIPAGLEHVHDQCSAAQRRQGGHARAGLAGIAVGACKGEDGCKWASECTVIT